MDVASSMHTTGTSEDDEEEEMDMDAKEEDDDDEGRNMAASMMVNMVGGISTSNNNNQFQYNTEIQEQTTSQGGAARRSRPLEEKERTKLRERHRRAITARILAGLRRHGKYNLRVRADINDVIAALAREAGWVVLPDGTTFPSRSQVPASFVINLLFEDLFIHVVHRYIVLNIDLFLVCAFVAI